MTVCVYVYRQVCILLFVLQLCTLSSVVAACIPEKCPFWLLVKEDTKQCPIACKYQTI